MMLPIFTMGRAMTEEEYLARLGLLRPQSGKRKPQDPIPPGSSVLDVPIGGTRRIPDTVLRRPPQPEDTIAGLPEPSMAQRHAEGLAGYLTPKVGGPRARAIAQTALGGDESVLPFGIGLQELVPFSPYVAEDAGRMVRSGVDTGSPLEVGLGLGLGALQALPAAKPLAQGAKAVGKRVREAADPEAIRQYIRQTQGLTGLPGTAAVRPKWGNWLAGSVEQATKPLQPLAGVRRLPAKDVMREMQETYPPEVLAGLSGETARVVKDSFESLKPQVAISDWIDQKLNKYIKNEMGTADDPIRKQVDEWAQTKAQLLAQKDEQIDRLQKKMVEARQARGLAPEQEAMLTRSRAELEELRRQRKYIEDQKGLHFDPYTVTNGEELTLDTIPGVVSQRAAYGFPKEGLGKDPTARQWETLSDMAISDIRAGTIQNAPNTAAQLAKAEQNYQQAVDSVNDAVRARIREKVPNISERDLNISAKDFNVQKSLRTKEETRLIEDAKAELFKAQNADKPKYKTMLEENPWVMGLDPEARLFERPITDELGFDHLVDELKNAMRPDSGLPSRLQLRPEDLSKMTVAKAARLVDEINAYRSGVKADADRAIASNAATVEVKSYDVIPGTDVPNTQGFAWKQIKPFQFRSEDQLQGEALEAYRRHLSLGATQEQAFKSVSDIYGRNAVQNALKYEGDILSHCVGGYCDDVLSGRSQIFSLRDANGMPAVTIETRPGRPWNQRSGFFYEHPELEQPWVEFSTAVKKQTKEQNLPRDPNYIIGFPKWLSENQPEMYAKYANLFEEVPADIIQIKGKKNGPPAPEHLPFVQEFVRNGNWGSIGDFKNTGFDFPATGPNGIFDADQIKTLEANGVRVPKLLTRDEAKSLQDQLYRIETGKNPETGMASGGLVQTTDTLRDNLVAAGMDPDLALMQGLRMAEQVEMAKGGLASVLKGAAPKTKGTYSALPLELPRAPAMSLQEMEKTAERVARQQLGEHVRKPKKTSNLADRSLKESKRLKNLSYVLESTKTSPLEKVVPEKKGQVRVALPGDISVADKVLMEVEGLPIGALQQGGPKYGAGKMDLPDPRFWASNEGPASILQRKVDDLAMVYETPEILAEHMAMGPVGMNFGQHLANANLMAINSSTPHPKAVEQFNEVIRRGFVDPQTKVRVEFPEFPGVENYKASYQAMKENPELRKWFNNRMKTEDVTAPLNFPRGKDIEYAVMEPELRDLEIGMTGLSVGRMQPGASLIKQSAHKTYSHDIPGLYLGRTQELLPVELAFPDASAFIKSTKRPADFTGTMQKVFPHQVVDEQYINELGQYYNRLRQIRGYKDGGAVEIEGAEDFAKQVMQKIANQKVSA